MIRLLLVAAVAVVIALVVITIFQGPGHWVVTKEQQDKLSEIAKIRTPISHPVLISVVPGAGTEPMATAYRLMNAFLNAGWPATLHTTDAEYSPTQTGLLVSMKVGTTDTSEADAVIAILKKAGLSPEFGHDHQMKDGYVKIVVGVTP